MTQELFRREALEARRTSALGAISLTQPLHWWVLAIAAVVAALVITLYLFFGSYTHRTTVAGQLVPVDGLLLVRAPAAGIVSELHASEGASLLSGQVLAVIGVPRVAIASTGTRELESSMSSRQSSLQAAQAGQLRALDAQAAGLKAQLDSARGEQEQIAAQIITRERQVRINEETLARMRELFRKQYVSQLQLGQQEAALLEQVGLLQSLQRQASAATRSIQMLQQSLDELPGQRRTLEASLQRELAAIAQERTEMHAAASVTINAPVSGLVATQFAKPGQAVQEGEPLLALLPGEGLLEAELLVPSRAVGFIASGDQVQLRYQPYPWQKFGLQRGEVASVSRSALEVSGGNQPVYRITVKLASQQVMAYGHAEPLKPGMLVDADICGETRRLVEWLFEPLLSLRGRLGAS